MKSDKDRHLHRPEEERKIREAALDETIDASFPVSDPPSSEPKQDEHYALDRRVPADNDPTP